MLAFRRPLFAILAAISITGAVAIPFGDPQFLDRAIMLEVAFIALAGLALKGIKKIVYACIPVAVLVMVGNSLAPPHVEIMTTFSKPFNAVVLIIGGYVLQGALIIASVLEVAAFRKNTMAAKTGPEAGSGQRKGP